MPSQQSKNLPNSLTALENLSFELSVLQAAEMTGEPFHPNYKKNRKNFRRLIKSFNTMADDLTEYFRLLSLRVQDKIDWNYYYSKIMKGAVITENVYWEDEIVTLQVAIEEGLEEAFDVGIQEAQTDLQIDYNYTSAEPYAQTALRNYSLYLAEGLNKTTQKKVRNSILRSIQLHESREQAVERLIELVDSPRRAVIIAQTEMLNAYSEGKIATAREVGAKYKTWEDGQPGACKLCSKLHTVQIPLEKEFEKDVFRTPRHPSCKCRMSIQFDKLTTK